MSTLASVPLPHPVRIPPSVPRIDPPQALAAALRADGRVWELGGRRCRIRISGTGGVERVVADGAPICGRIGVEGLTGANVIASPRLVRRECYGPGGGCAESLLVPDALPGAVLQWEPGPGAPTPAAVDLELLPPATASGSAAAPSEPVHQVAAPSALVHHAAPGLLWVSDGRRGVLVCAPGSSAPPHVREEGGRTLARVPLAPGPDDPRSTLLVVAAPPDAPWAPPAALAGVKAHGRRAELDARSSDDPGLVLETGIPAVDEAVYWTRAWLRAALFAPPGLPTGLHPPLAGARLSRAAVALGDREVAEAALRHLSWASPLDRAESLGALSAWVAWTGRGRPFLEARTRIDAALLEPGGLKAAGPGEPGLPPARADALRRAVADAAEALGEEEWAKRIRVPPRDSGGVRLATLGAGPSPDPSGPTPGSIVELYRQGLHDEGLRALRSAMDQVHDDPRTLAEGSAPALALGLVEGLLGARPDAAFGRVVLAPTLPGHWTRFAARGIRVEEGHLDLEFEREGPVHRWLVRPGRGSVPLMVIFEPWLPARELASIRVDGEPAEADPRPDADGLRVPLQTPADAVRVIELEAVSPSR